MFNEESLLGIHRLYISEAKRLPLLGAAEEYNLILKFKAGKAADLLLADAERENPAYAVDNLVEASEQGQKALNVLVRSNVRLVLWPMIGMVMRGELYLSTEQDAENVFQAGNYGLIVAINRYDLNRRTPQGNPPRLSTYAPFWIRKYIRAEFTQSHIITPPRSAIGQEDQNARLKYDPISLDYEMLGKGGVPTNFGDIIPAVDGFRQAYRDEVKEMIEDILSFCFSPKEVRIFKLHSEGLTFEEIGNKLGLSRQRVHKIESDARRRFMGSRFYDLLRETLHELQDSSRLFQR